MAVMRNGKEEFAHGKNGLKFKECRYFDGHVSEHDKLDLLLQDIDIHGTFEVGDLPASDAVLLLVVQRRPGSKTVTFQSFAFPSSSGRDVQLAVIDAYIGNSTSAHLKMEDHITGKERQTVSKRIEQLNFNRVYAVEEGSYDASISDRSGNSEVADDKLEWRTRQALKLSKHESFVVLRTGDEEQAYPQSLVVFPPQSGASGRSLGMVSILLALVFAFPQAV